MMEEGNETHGPPYETDRESLERDCTLEFLKASGPGGQHRNKRETAVRLHHRPSGITLVASERRSQAQNREAAFERLVERLEELNRVPVRRKRTRKPRSAERKRLDEKKRRGATKKMRKKPEDD